MQIKFDQIRLHLSCPETGLGRAFAMQAKGIKLYLVIRAGYLKSLKVPNAPICCLSGAILVDLRVMGGA